MDDQHGILMDTMNDLRLALVRGSSRELIEFTRMHFWSEEQLLQQYGFPGLAEHCAAHHSLLAQILQSAHRVQYGEGVEIRSLLSFLRGWYLEHIESLDQQYGPWLNEHGVV